MDGKTSTFTIYHEHCDPSKWGPRDVLALAKFIASGDLRYAAHLSRLGMQLILSEHHEPKGGALNEVGWCNPDHLYEFAPLDELADDQDVTPVCRIYQGPVEFAIRIPVGDGEGNFEGYEYETKPTEAEANTYIAGVMASAEE